MSVFCTVASPIIPFILMTAMCLSRLHALFLEKSPCSIKNNNILKLNERFSMKRVQILELIVLVSQSQHAFAMLKWGVTEGILLHKRKQFLCHKFHWFFHYFCCPWCNYHWQKTHLCLYQQLFFCFWSLLLFIKFSSGFFLCT